MAESRHARSVVVALAVLALGVVLGSSLTSSADRSPSELAEPAGLGQVRGERPLPVVAGGQSGLSTGSTVLGATTCITVSDDSYVAEGILTPVGLETFFESGLSDLVGEQIGLVQSDTPDLAPDDLLAIETAGAYGAVMASTYNTRLPVAEIMVNGGKFSVIRPRPDYDSLLSLDQMPDWLRD